MVTTLKICKPLTLQHLLTYAENVSHPYHYSTQKNIVQRLVDLAVPVGLFWVYFQFYNFGKITPSEMVKTTGLLAIVLLSLTLIIGPLCRLFPFLDFLKAHRKFWGILSFLIALVHGFLAYVYSFNSNFSKLFDSANPKYYGVLAAFIALVILLIITLSSSRKVLNSISPKTWKMIQSASYLALIFAILHFYLVESTNGVLIIKRILGQITFAFAAIVVVIRFVVMFLPAKK